MTEQVMRVGKLAPSRESSDDTVDGTPLVLWAGTEPNAVIAYRKQRHLLRTGVTQEFVALGPGATWKVSHRMSQGEAAAPEGTDVYDPTAATAADVDGDGVDELVLVRNTGAVEVWRGGKKLGALPGAGESGEYDLKATFEARLADREELYLLFNRRPWEKEGAGAEPYLLVRVGSAAPSRVVLQGLTRSLRSVMAVGALNLPGSKGVDELLAVSLVEEKGQLVTYLSRHRVDGAAIGSPRKIYQPFDIEANPGFAFVPQSDRAVALSPRDGKLLFFTPGKPVNWVRAVDLGGVAREAFPVSWFGLSDAGRDPKFVVRREDALYAVDEEGRFHDLVGGRWVPRKEPKPKPFYEVPRKGSPEEGAFDLVGVFPAGGSADEFLVVHARHPQARGLTDEEREAAAKRFLSADDLETATLRGSVRMDPDGDIYRGEIQEELVKRGSKEQVKTVEDWKRLAPRSYAAAELKRRGRYQDGLSYALFNPLDEGGKIPEDCPDPDGYRAWLDALSLPAKTVGTLVSRGAAVASFEIDAIPPPNELGAISGPLLSFRSRGGALTAVLPILGPPEGAVPSGFYVVRASSGTR